MTEFSFSKLSWVNSDGITYSKARLNRVLTSYSKWWYFFRFFVRPLTRTIYVRFRVRCSMLFRLSMNSMRRYSHLIRKWRTDVNLGAYLLRESVRPLIRTYRLRVRVAFCQQTVCDEVHTTKSYNKMADWYEHRHIHK